MATNDEYALLAAYANSPMTQESLQLGTGGQEAQNFILPSGWEAKPITLDNIQDVVNAQIFQHGLAQAQLTTADLDGMGALLLQKFVNGVAVETVISFRGTQFDEGMITGPGFRDAIADMYLGTGILALTMVYLSTH